ncbi:MAG TPA: enolase C-terminal domain-like protein [Pelobium sp.]
MHAQQSPVYKGIKIQHLNATTYTIPTDLPESDGTLAWDSTTLVLIELEAGGKKAIGFTYANACLLPFIHHTLKPLLIGKNPMDIASLMHSLTVAIRNEGNSGLVARALSAIDVALWDLKAKILGLPLCKLLGMVKAEVAVYGSGGFTSYTAKQLQTQLEGWANEGFSAVKMKIGRNPDKDLLRIKNAKAVIGQANLMVDANGAYDAKTALSKAIEFTDYGINWFEEPVSSDDLAGLNFIRNHAPAKINIAAGEYGDNYHYFYNMLQAKAVDVLQADASRCGGITGFIKAGKLAEAFHIPFSFHCAPSLHLHPATSLNSFTIGEYFHDHVRIESLFFDGFVKPKNGMMIPDLERYGLGLTFKHQDAEKYKIN